MRDSYYLTTPIYYVNGRPHIGHAYTTIAGDAICRWMRLKGKRVYFQTGTDEHGQKVWEKARERGMEPQEHCDDMVVHWKAAFERLQITNDRFFRTTDPAHADLVTAVLTALHDAGLIYKDAYEGWYDVSAEVFVTDKEREERLAAGEEEAAFTQITETNWWFRMSQYQERLTTWIHEHPSFIQPEARKNEVLGFLRTKTLGDLCISRPKERMPWGIEIPFDPDFVTYVWFDALLNYLTGTGFHVEDGKLSPPADFSDWRELWPADVHLIGKDILTTHAIYWTTMLFALSDVVEGADTPESERSILPVSTLYAHGWWTSRDGQKMSKSKGNTIDINLLADGYGVDALRWFVLREIAFGADGGFSYEVFQTRYNSDLANDLGNLFHRAGSMSQNWLGGVVPEWGSDHESRAKLTALVAENIKTFDASMDALQFHEATAAANAIAVAGNGHVQESEPWALNKAGDEAGVKTSLRIAMELSYAAFALSLPIMPERAAAFGVVVGKSVADMEDDARAWLRGERILDALVPNTELKLEVLFPRFREFPEAIAALFAEAEAEAPPPKPKKAKKSKAAPEPPAEIEFADFAKLKLRVGKVLSVDDHPQADKLFVLKVDIGEGEPRQIVAGLKSTFTADQLLGRTVVVVANLKPVELRGVLSQGMVLAAGAKVAVDLLTVDAEPGEVVR